MWRQELRRETEETARAKDAKEDWHGWADLGLRLASLAALARKQFDGRKAGSQKGHDGGGIHSAAHRSVGATFNHTRPAIVYFQKSRTETIRGPAFPIPVPARR
jgi:hypothetical protein